MSAFLGRIFSVFNDLNRVLAIPFLEKNDHMLMGLGLYHAAYIVGLDIFLYNK